MTERDQHWNMSRVARAWRNGVQQVQREWDAWDVSCRAETPQRRAVDRLVPRIISTKHRARLGNEPLCSAYKYSAYYCSTYWCSSKPKTHPTGHSQLPTQHKRGIDYEKTGKNKQKTTWICSRRTGFLEIRRKLCDCIEMQDLTYPWASRKKSEFKHQTKCTNEKHAKKTLATPGIVDVSILSHGEKTLDQCGPQNIRQCVFE
ncbi:predicted protein [Histoplasma capsulatum H143]|uniref:Uncharacterized protein n=1 Tax=Ajellomyces capsulatus (strain H143) TaxID=544712 RepID=C6H5A9_AJECH|nr:predicted protein [Histoplasma capsulatum H143]